MTAPKTTDDLAAEAVELMRRKNIRFSVKTAGKQWACAISPRDEYEKSRSESSSSISSSSTSSSGASTPVSEKSESSSHSSHGRH